MSTSIYLDESGDLGWTLDKPHNKGGSSRYLTLAAVIVPTEKYHHVTRIVRNLYKARGRPQSSELKSVELRPHERETFVRDLLALRNKHPDILFTAITVNKAGVATAFRQHPNGLYNYMTKLMRKRATQPPSIVSVQPSHLPSNLLAAHPCCFPARSKHAVKSNIPNLARRVV